MAIPLGYSLHLRHQKQQLQNDCWATCLAMICDWRGVAITRPDILTRPHILQSYTYGEMAICAEANKVIKTMSNGTIAFELLGAKTLEADDFMQYTNRRRVVMLSMDNHMWLITGYDGGGGGDQVGAEHRRLHRVAGAAVPSGSSMRKPWVPLVSARVHQR